MFSFVSSDQAGNMSAEEKVCLVKKYPQRCGCPTDCVPVCPGSDLLSHPCQLPSLSNSLGTCEPSSAQNVQAFSTKAKVLQESAAKGKNNGT